MTKKQSKDQFSLEKQIKFFKTKLAHSNSSTPRKHMSKWARLLSEAEARLNDMDGEFRQ